MLTLNLFNLRALRLSIHCILVAGLLDGKPHASALL